MLFDVVGCGGAGVAEITGKATGLGSETLVGGWRGLAERGRFGRRRIRVWGHGDGGVFVGRVSAEGGRRGLWVDGCRCGHGGCVVCEERTQATSLS